MKIKHSLVVPCYNEEGNVENFLNEAKAAMVGYTDSYEIIFVNDGSNDCTEKNLKKIWRENNDTRIKIVSFTRNFGKEAAIYAGLCNAKGEYITVIDADLQQDPVYAVQMGRILDENPEYDMIAAYQSERKEGKLKSGLKTLFYKFISKTSKIDFVTDASDFRTMRRCVADTIVALPEYHRFSKGIFSWVGYNTCSMPYDVRDRVSGETKWSFMKLVKYALDGIIAYTDLPLKLPLYTSIFTGLLSLIIFISAIIVDVFSSHITSPWIYLIGAVLFATSMICALIGILACYIGKIHSEVKHRPIYIAKEILTYENNEKTDN